ncbi:MAG: 1-acyl-sn-glycerol-3-phosphate acyltransferase [Thermoleophilia bacterium]|nr:1-acyl-sn-glycerol-3-phosphate acyltransferase [Thermoleophilia bacterium]
MRVMPFYLGLGIVSWPLVRLVFRLRAHGVESLPVGGFVLAANHVSNFDPWALGYPLFPRRQLRFMGKSELFNPVLGPLLRAGGAFPVRRGEGDLAAIETAVELAKSGAVVAMFPEGTRRKKGLVKKFQARPHTGAARVALEAGVPLVPAAIAGTDRLSRLGPLRVLYGSPVEIDDLRNDDPREASREATERLFEAIAALERRL